VTHSAIHPLGLGVLAKYPAPGEVKTRLATTLGSSRAAWVARSFVETVVVRLTPIDADLFLAASPPEASPAFRAWLGGDWRITVQSDGDLGVRLQRVFDEAFTRGHERVVVLGTDSPTLPLGRIEEAFAALESHDVTLGPTEDGGYYLVGAARRTPPIFDAMPWSTSALWDATVAALSVGNLSWHALAPWYDVDEAADLQRLIAELAAADEPALQVLSRSLANLLV
jgi:rSAM/selenodomain-associated transferase 1